MQFLLLPHSLVPNHSSRLRRSLCWTKTMMLRTMRQRDHASAPSDGELLQAPLRLPNGHLRLLRHSHMLTMLINSIIQTAPSPQICSDLSTPSKMEKKITLMIVSLAAELALKILSHTETILTTITQPIIASSIRCWIPSTLRATSPTSFGMWVGELKSLPWKTNVLNSSVTRTLPSDISPN